MNILNLLSAKVLFMAKLPTRMSRSQGPSATRIVQLLFLCLPSMSMAQDSSPSPCGPLYTPGHYGPADYRTASRSSKELVEGAHFTPGVESLKVGKTGLFGGDISYTLRVFPNHPRALAAMERLAEKEKANPPPASEYTIECWYERAMRYQPDDPVVRLLYVNFLIKRNQQEQANQHLKYVIESASDNPFTQFNAGMLLFDMRDYDGALRQAHKALAMGLPRPELRDRLKSVGRWEDPKAEAPTTPASAP